MTNGGSSANEAPLLTGRSTGGTEMPISRQALSALACFVAVMAGGCTDLDPAVGTDVDAGDATMGAATGGSSEPDGGAGSGGTASGGDAVTSGGAPSSGGDAMGGQTTGSGGEPAAQPECASDDDCQSGYACVSEKCEFVPPERVPSAIVQTVGGGRASGGGLRVELRVGGPVPAGRMAGAGYRVTLGPLATGH